MKRLGVAGGLGPAATALFYETLLKLTQAETDQEHIDTIIISYPSIPDRTAFLTGKASESPVAPVKEVLKTLEVLKVDYIAIPCVTIHCFYDELIKDINTPVINMISETSYALNAMNIKKAGIMATEGTVKAGIFQRGLAEAGIETLYPIKTQGLLSEIIYNIKAGKTIDIDGFNRVSEELFQYGAQINVLGCTELPLIKKIIKLSDGFLDTVELLARRSLFYCQAKIYQADLGESQ